MRQIIAIIRAWAWRVLRRVFPRIKMPEGVPVALPPAMRGPYPFAKRRAFVSRNPGSQGVHRERRRAFARGDVDEAARLVASGRPVEPMRHKRRDK